MSGRVEEPKVVLRVAERFAEEKRKALRWARARGVGLALAALVLAVVMGVSAVVGDHATAERVCIMLLGMIQATASGAMLLGALR